MAKKEPSKESPDEKKKESPDEKKRDEALERAIEQIKKQFGKGAIMKMGEGGYVPVEAVPTGALSLDLALGGAGIPRGRVAEIFGPEASGKTTLCYHIMANAQKQGGVAAFIDVEHAMEPSYCRKLGLDLDSLLVSQPDTGEQALDIAELLIRSNAVDVVVLDSVAALVPRAELEGEMGDQHIGLQARLMSQALRKLTAAIARSRTSMIFTNQIREKIGVMFGNPETTPGGRALKFYAAIRIDIRRIASIREGDKIIGQRCKAKVVKNKVAPPFRSAEFDILWGEGISYAGDLLDLGVGLKLVDKTGAWLTFGPHKLGQGRNNARLFLRDNKELAAQLEAAIRQNIGVSPDATPQEE